MIGLPPLERESNRNVARAKRTHATLTGAG
jgi:hypothetical protein